jgi:hypothetical protein
VGCTWEWDLRGGGMRMGFAGRGMGIAEHGMTAGNRNGLYGEGGRGMAEHGMAAYPLLP